MSPCGVIRPPWVNQDKNGWTGGDKDSLGEGMNKETEKCVIPNIDVKKTKEMIHRISAAIFASKKYIIVNITELESLDFPRILRQQCNIQRFFQAWNAILSNLMTFAWYQDNWTIHFMSQDIDKSSLHFEKKVFLWMKIVIWHTCKNPNMEFPDISLTFAPFQNFPDIISNSLTIPWPWKNKMFPDFSLTCGNPEHGAVGRLKAYTFADALEAPVYAWIEKYTTERIALAYAAIHT